jgi:hypothetical protein
MGESWLSVLFAVTVTMMTTAAVTGADPSSTPSLSTTTRNDDVPVDSKRVCSHQLSSGFSFLLISLPLLT